MEDHRARRARLKHRGIAPVIKEAHFVRPGDLQWSDARQQQIDLGCCASCYLGNCGEWVWSASGEEARITDRHPGGSSPY
jgi:hypothetical protein